MLSGNTNKFINESSLSYAPSQSTSNNKLNNQQSNSHQQFSTIIYSSEQGGRGMHGTYYSFFLIVHVSRFHVGHSFIISSIFAFFLLARKN